MIDEIFNASHFSEISEPPTVYDNASEQHEHVYRLRPIDIDNGEKVSKRVKTWDEMSPQERESLMNEMEHNDTHRTSFLRSFNKHWKPSKPLHDARYRLLDDGENVVVQDRGYFVYASRATESKMDDMLLYGYKQQFPTIRKQNDV